MNDVAQWRRSLAALGTLSEEDLDELESHLLDHIDALVEQGIDRFDAFERAVAALGEVRAIADESAKVNPLLAWRSALFWTGVHAWLVASIVMSAMLPILVGTLAFRLRDLTTT